MRRYPQLSTVDEETLNALCRDDGYTVVTPELVVQTSNPNAPNLGGIIDVLQGSAAMLGQSIQVDEVPQSVIDAEIAAPEAGLALDHLEGQGAIERQLHALCQTAVNENSSDIHVLTT
ncbi:type II secretion protein, partial [Vibrio sp. 10N.286.54.A9]